MACRLDPSDGWWFCGTPALLALVPAVHFVRTGSILAFLLMLWFAASAIPFAWLWAEVCKEAG